MNRRLSLFIVLCLIVVVIAASLAVLYENGFLTDSTEPEPQEPDEPIEPEEPDEPTEPEEPEPSILWQIDIEHFANDFTVAYGKVFATDGWGNIYCFDAKSGESLWKTSLVRGAPAAGGSTIAYYEGKVYVGSRGSIVNKLDADTGKLELTFQAPTSTTFGSKSPPKFFVADGKVFASQNGIAVYNASDGELFWEQTYGITLGNASISAPESNFVLVMGNSRINPNNGSTLWSVQGISSDPAVVTQGKVILWNYEPVWSPDGGQTLLCVNVSSGDILWSFDVGARMFQPTVSNDLVLFGAEDGYFYAVNFANGTLKWRTFVDDQNLIETFNGYTEAQQAIMKMRASLVQVDPQDQTVFWSVIVGYNGDNVYNGTVWSLDLLSGSRIWTLPVKNNDSVFTNYAAFVNVALSNNLLYVTEHSDLYCLDKYTGDIQLRRNFEHYILPPIAADNKVFVAADLYLIAYG